MGSQQLLLGGGPGVLTPEEAINFFYNHATSLIALDIDNVQSWVPRGRLYTTNTSNIGGWLNATGVLFDYSVDGLSGKAANSNFTTVLPIAYGNDDFSAAPGGSVKTFSNLSVSLNGGGTVTATLVDNPGSALSDYGNGIGTFEVTRKVRDFNSLTLDITKAALDNAGVYHTALIPGRWQWISNHTSYNVIAGNTPFAASPLGPAITEYAELSVTIPPFSFLVYSHASRQAAAGNLPNGEYYHQFATLPSGTVVVYERRPLLDNFSYMDMMIANLTSSSQAVVLRFPWTLLVEISGESGSSFESRAGYRFGSAHLFGPRTYFDTPDPLGSPPPNGFIVSAENTSSGNPTITFNPTGTISVLYDNGDTTTSSWASPSNPANGSYYFIRITQTLSTDGEITSIIGGALGTWIPLTASVSVSRNMPASGSHLTTGTVQISTTPSPVGIVSTGQYRLNGVFFETGGGGGGSSSVWVNSYLPSGILSGDAQPGDDLLLLSPDYSGAVKGEVITTRTSTQQMVTLISESGIRLTVSDSTPLTLRNGGTLLSIHAVGAELPVQDENGFRWEKIVSVMPAGEGEVATIFCDNQCYAAGDAPDRFIWTHNQAVDKN